MYGCQIHPTVDVCSNYKLFAKIQIRCKCGRKRENVHPLLQRRGGANCNMVQYPACNKGFKRQLICSFKKSKLNIVNETTSVIFNLKLNVVGVISITRLPLSYRIKIAIEVKNSITTLPSFKKTLHHTH